jgi:hypothetical protein
MRRTFANHKSWLLVSCAAGHGLVRARAQTRQQRLAVRVDRRDESEEALVAINLPLSRRSR